MSHPQTNSDALRPRLSVFSALVIAAVFAVFIVIYAFVRQDPVPARSYSGGAEDEKWKDTSAGRGARLAELHEKEMTDATTYGWVDQNAGKVRLPIDRAMELTIAEMNASRK